MCLVACWSETVASWKAFWRRLTRYPPTSNIVGISIWETPSLIGAMMIPSHPIKGAISVLSSIQRFAAREQLSHLLSPEFNFKEAPRVDRAIAPSTLIPMHDGLG